MWYMVHSRLYEDPTDTMVSGILLILGIGARM